MAPWMICVQPLPTNMNLLLSGLPMEDCQRPVAVAWCLFSSGLNPLPSNWNELHQLEPILLGDHVLGHSGWSQDRRRWNLNEVSSFVLPLPTFLSSTLPYLFTKDLRLLVTMTLFLWVCVPVCVLVCKWIAPFLCFLSVCFAPRGNFSLFNFLFSHLKLRSVKRKLLPIKAGTRVTGNDLWFKCNL